MSWEIAGQDYWILTKCQKIIADVKCTSSGTWIACIPPGTIGFLCTSFEDAIIEVEKQLNLTIIKAHGKTQEVYSEIWIEATPSNYDLKVVDASNMPKEFLDGAIAGMRKKLEGMSISFNTTIETYKSSINSNFRSFRFAGYGAMRDVIRKYTNN